MPSIIAQELIEIWRQLLRGVQQDIWYALIIIDDFGCNLQTATNLAGEEYDSLLISSGITFKKGNITMIRKAKLDYLQTALKENIILHITLSKLERNGNKMFFRWCSSSNSMVPSGGGGSIISRCIVCSSSRKVATEKRRWVITKRSIREGRFCRRRRCGWVTITAVASRSQHSFFGIYRATKGSLLLLLYPSSIASIPIIIIRIACRTFCSME